jgi:hypothetical protein
MILENKKLKKQTFNVTAYIREELYTGIYIYIYIYIYLYIKVGRCRSNIYYRPIMLFHDIFLGFNFLFSRIIIPPHLI